MTQEEADALVDKSVKRVLTAYAKGGYLTLVQVDEDGYAKEEAGRTELIKPGTDNQALADLYDASNEAVEKVAEEGGVLLKNENKTLPLDTTGDKSVAVVGVNGMTLISGIGGERSYGSIRAMTSPYEALTDILGTDKVEGQVYNEQDRNDHPDRKSVYNSSRKRAWCSPYLRYRKISRDWWKLSGTVCKQQRSGDQDGRTRNRRILPG